MGRSGRKWREVTTLGSFKDRPKIRVLGIVRVSTDKQAKQGESLDAQLDSIENWIRVKASLNRPQEWELVDVLTEGEENGKRRGRTGTTRKGRDCLQKAMLLAKADEIDCIVATKLDRIARNLRDYLDIAQELNRANVALVVFDLDFDTSTPDGQMIMRFFASMAQWQADRISQYAYETTLRHLEQGRPIGPPPVGYKKGDKTFAVDEAYAEHVRLIDELYLQTKSIDKTLEILAERGLKTKRGKYHTKNQVSKILNNIRYLARQEYEGRVYDGNWPPLRDEETHARIQKSLRKNTRTRHGGHYGARRYHYMFQGILRCGQCKGAMTPKPATGRNGNRYPYYVCALAAKSRGKSCEIVRVPARAADDAIMAYLGKLRFEPQIVKTVLAKADTETSKRLDALVIEMESSERRLDEVKRKIANIVDSIADGGREMARTLQPKLVALHEEETDITAKVERLREEQRGHLRQVSTAHEQIQMLAMFGNLVKLHEGNPERIKAIIPKFVNYVVWHKGNEETGEGRMDVLLYGRPFANVDDAGFWREAMAELSARQQEAEEPAVAPEGAGSSGSNIWGRSVAFPAARE